MDSSPCPTWLLDYLRCPITYSKLSSPSSEWFERLAESHRLMPLKTRIGRSVSVAPTQGLLSADRHWLYPANNQIPTLIPDDAIAVPKELILYDL